MMMFRQIKVSLCNNILGPAAAGRFRMIGYQKQAQAAEETVGANRLVQVYYKSGNFPAGRPTGPVQHKMTFQLDLTVSTGMLGDMSAINNPDATPAELAAALANFQDASEVADESMDELFEIVYQIIMDGRNNDLGFSRGQVTGRWIGELRKDTPIPRGEYVILTGSAQLTVSASEMVEGDTGVEAAIMETTLNLDGDDVTQTGVTVTQ